MIYAECTAGAQTHHLELLTEKPIKSSMYYMTYCQASMEWVSSGSKASHSDHFRTCLTQNKFHSKRTPFLDCVVYALKTNSSELDERKSRETATSIFFSPSCFVSFRQPQKLYSGFCSAIRNTRHVWKYRPLWKDDCLVPLGFRGGG